MTGLTFTERFIKARHDVIALDFKHLNDMQLKAVMTTEGPLLLLAGAGSGKTTVLINRIANLLKYGRGADTTEVPDFVTEQDLQFLEHYAKNPTPEGSGRALSLCAVEPVEPWRMIAITFTNKAADELKARLERVLGEGANDVWAMTFHSACVRILRRDIDRLGFDRSFTIYDSSDSQSLMKRILKELDMDDKTYPPRTLLGYISRAKDEMISAESFYESADKSGDIRRRHIGRAYLEYSNRMKASNALDFDDLILFTVRLLQEHEDVLEYYQRRFRYVLIDEYQDTNNLQYLLASLLAGGHENICVVGDDDQSIYKFRGATIENILSFESNYKNARVIRLEQNYRSTGYILSAANDVIKNNQGRKGKKLWTEKENGEKLTLHVAHDEREEASFVTSRIIADLAAGDKWSDHAVLYRLNAQSNALEYAFKRSGVPYRIIGGTRFFDRAEIKDMLAYLCVVVNPSDDLRLMRIINNPPRGIGQVTLDAVEALAARTGQPVFEVLKESEAYEDLRKAAPKLHQFVNLITDLQSAAAEAPLDGFYDTLIERTGYVKVLEAKATDENLTRIENVQELKSNIVNFLREMPEGTLFDFLNEIALYTDIDQYDKNADSVVMMTMHSAKGLEFDTVFIVGAEEGIFPGVRSIGEAEEMEEERRLCYVAMTRARKKLYFTAARQRMIFGRTTAGRTSRFVDEVSSENIEKPEAVSAPVGYIFDDGEASEKHETASRSFSRVYRAERQDYKKRDLKPITPPGAAAAPVPAYNKGDVVNHKAFGRGLITDVQPAGGDALIEVAFDSVGTKRLMAKSASAYMQKI
ncbi:DNA helicase-2 / ATP-dependent DNA helicase PcrA [Sporobacter termitidis DSM 10068]|uniref:DNA 3'-5' helicase n=1 Tax=Sporobacter termitidis DSM 10068 TaxID=1123282 RepID=A0A1M5VJ36_9FIRM|nr:UvrD-helicase domain-containing protein [Sporobacter termitidis]SHH75215.1 DNA helicase-2 / ATP-dependent DNA helicase PcrA [Sporobacter termitidis DSM 10068]